MENVTHRPYQAAAIAHAVDWASTAKPGDKILYASPTGSGKSLIELEVQRKLPNYWIVTPKIEIIRDMLQKLGINTRGYSEDQLRKIAWNYKIVTPVTLRNRLSEGFFDTIEGFIIDECHHDNAQTYQELHALIGYKPAIGYTATPYRGTPKATKELLENWGEPVWIITYPDAQSEGWISIPSCVTWPLVDDDQIEIVNGELVANQITNATKDKLDEVIRQIWKFRCNLAADDKATMISLPSVELAEMTFKKAKDAGLDVVLVTGKTSYNDRQEAFRKTLSREAILIQIDVVSEGNDLRIERLIDLSPTLSPVKWLQRIGRIMRPELLPEYICCNRNLERHGYLLDGCIPSAWIGEAQKAFPIPSSRMSVRALGLESVGKLKPAYLATLSGVTIAIYAVSQVQDNRVVNYCAIIHPAREEIIWSIKRDDKLEGTKSYGRWFRCEPPKMLEGFASMKNSNMSEKQLDWWKRSAASVGLNPNVVPTSKEFQVLPVLLAIGMRIV